MAVYKAPDGNNRKSGSRYKTSGQNSENKKSVVKKEPPARSNNKKTKNKKTSHALVITIIIILIIAAACIVGFLILRGRQTAGNNTLPTEISTAASTEAAHTIEQMDMPPLTSDDGTDGYLDGAVYIWNNKGFELFKGNVKTAVSYAKSISNYKTFLGGDIKVYSMVVPSNTEFGLPERIGKDISNTQRDNTEAIITNLSADVIPVDVYNVLGQHRNDDIFYNTDNHWTSLGAYYAYTVFAKQAGFEAKSLSDFKENTAGEEFLGSYISATVTEETKNGNPKLLANPDTVKYYDMPEGCTVTVLKSGAVYEEEISFYNTELSSGSAPNEIFATAECAYAKIVNSNIKNGGKIAVVKDAFGDAIAPFLAQHYSEVHLIDITNFKRNLKTYCTDNKITDVLFLNGIMSANSAVQTAKTDAMFD